MIPAKLLPAYDWSITETDATITATFHFPPTFNLSCLTAELLHSGTEIEITIPDQPVLLAGLLPHPASRAAIRLDPESHSAHVVLTKSEPGRWEFVVANRSPTSSRIDPKSAFVIWSALQLNGTAEVRFRAADLLQFSAGAGYLPALLVLARTLFLHSETRDQGIEYLRLAAEFYQDRGAASELGFIMATAPETREDGLGVLNTLADQGVFEANWLLGRLYSPLCPGDFRPKDAAVALRRFSAALAIKEDPQIMFEAARILHEGPPGVRKDRARAMELWRGAKAMMESLPELPGRTARADGAWWVAAAVGGAVSLAGVAFWQYRRRGREND
jgi:hypothetical protein